MYMNLESLCVFFLVSEISHGVSFSFSYKSYASVSNV